MNSFFSDVFYILLAFVVIAMCSDERVDDAMMAIIES